MSVFLFRVKSTVLERAQAKDGQPLVLHVKPDNQLDAVPGDIAIICIETNKSAPACFALSAVSRGVPLKYDATIVQYESSRKDSHLLRFPNGLQQNKNLRNSKLKVYDNKGELLSAEALSSKECEGIQVSVEKADFSFKMETRRCNLLQEGELVIESDSEDTQAYRKIEDEQYVSAIQQLIAQKEKPDLPPPPPPASSSSTSSSPQAQAATQASAATPAPPPQSIPHAAADVSAKTVQQAQQASNIPPSLLQQSQLQQPSQQTSQQSPQLQQQHLPISYTAAPSTGAAAAANIPPSAAAAAAAAAAAGTAVNLPPSATSPSSSPRQPPRTTPAAGPPPAPPAPKPGSQKPKPKTTPKTPHSNTNGVAEKREQHDGSEAKRQKTAPPTPPTGDITPVDLLVHVTSVAGMLKELDAEHSERLSRLEEEVAQLHARLRTLPAASPSGQSPSLTKEISPTSGASRKRGRPSKSDLEYHHQSPSLSTTPGLSPSLRSNVAPDAPLTPPQLPLPATTTSTSSAALKTVTPQQNPLHFSPGEFIAVRVDPSSSNDGYWMARVIPGAPKQGLVRVKWFEKYLPLPGWYFMDTREDLVDPLSIFHRNFELAVKPWKNRSGNFIDIFRPLVDLATYDMEK